MGLKELAERVADAMKPVSPETAEARHLIEQYQTEAKAANGGRHYYYDVKPSDFSTGRAILQSDPQVQAEVLRELIMHKDNAYGSPFHTLKAQLLSRNLPQSLSGTEALLKKAVASSS